MNCRGDCSYAHFFWLRRSGICSLSNDPEQLSLKAEAATSKASGKVCSRTVQGSLHQPPGRSSDCFQRGAVHEMGYPMIYMVAERLLTRFGSQVERRNHHFVGADEYH